MRKEKYLDLFGKLMQYMNVHCEQLLFCVMVKTVRKWFTPRRFLLCVNHRGKLPHNKNCSGYINANGVSVIANPANPANPAKTGRVMRLLDSQ